MKSFQKFLEEISIKGNPGIPGEGGRREGEPNYVSDSERRARTRLNAREGDQREIMQNGQRMMQLLKTSMAKTAGKEDQLTQLAESVFRSLYQDLIDRYEIELDIKLIKPGKVKDWMDEQEEEDQDPPEEFRRVTDEDIKNEIYKRKIANLIIQGEAKNTKHILHSDEVKEGLNEIFGEEEGEEMFNLWDEMSKIADKMDWMIPIDIKSDMMEKEPQGMAGACSVGWKPKENKEEEDTDEEEEGEEYFGDEDEEEMYSDDDQPMERFDETPILRARGVDFPMLLHESVKALFELLSIGSIPEDKTIASTALMNNGINDEPEDFRYGPEIASDLRDFVNQNEKVDTYPNVREELYKLMVDKETMPTKDFLELMRGILAKTDRARSAVDRLINKVIETIKEDKDAMRKYQQDMDEYESRMKEIEADKNRPKPKHKEEEREEDSEIERIIKQSNQPKETGYADMAPSEIQALIDDALDNGDYEKVKMLSQYLKEGREIYLKEVEMILENKNPHTKY